MSARIWYAQLDAYDSVRRMLALLAAWTRRPPTQERLYICDFYLANPALLHESHMPVEIRQAFRSVAIERPEKEFVSFPAAPVLFAKMEPVQREALQTLVGKGQIDLALFKGGRVALLEGVRAKLRVETTEREADVLRFLVESFSMIGEGQPGALRVATGLRRAGA